jgi:hypothetical protein
MDFFRSTDFGDLGRYYGQNKAIVGVFNGPVVPFRVNDASVAELACRVFFRLRLVRSGWL